MVANWAVLALVIATLLAYFTADLLLSIALGAGAAAGATFLLRRWSNRITCPCCRQRMVRSPACEPSQTPATGAAPGRQRLSEVTGEYGKRFWTAEVLFHCPRCDREHVVISFANTRREAARLAKVGY